MQLEPQQGLTAWSQANSMAMEQQLVASVQELAEQVASVQLVEQDCWAEEHRRDARCLVIVPKEEVASVQELVEPMILARKNQHFRRC